MEKDDRFIYFLKYGILRRFEGEAEIIFVEIPQIPKKIVVYRRPLYRQKAYDRLYLNNMDLPHVPLFEGEENLKLLSLENNMINKIDHLVSLNNLLYLNLYANKIYEIENLQTVPKLRALMLGKNQIEKMKNLNWLVDLEVLDLHSNKIKLIENLSSLKKLRLLNLANNQITTFGELVIYKNLEEINLRKNLIVSIPNQLNLIDKLKKLNLGKNMISKLDNLSELKKAKTLTELIIEDNPVLVLKESSDILKTLPLKSKNANGSSTGVKESSSVNSSIIMKKSKDKATFKVDASSPLLKKSLAYVNEQLPDINTIEIKDIKEYSSTQQNIIFKSEEISQAQSTNIKAHIEKEWLCELDYIIENGYNGYNTKRLKESKIVSGHAELEGNNKLNIFGNALEVLDQEEFYTSITVLHFEYFNIDLISVKNIIDKLRNFKNLTKLVFSHNNIHSFYQLIKFEDILDIEAISITNNEINNSTFLKYFLLYRFQNLKLFNEQEISQQDVIAAKRMFEYFDKCISHNENKGTEENNLTAEIKKLEYDRININKKKDLFSFIQENMADILEEIIDEYVI